MLYHQYIRLPSANVSTIPKTTLYAWGLNSYGQLGDGTTINKSNPVALNARFSPTSSSGNNHTAIVYSDGSLYMTGFNQYGQLGDGTTINKSTPVKIGSSSWTIVTAQADSTVGLTIANTLFSWGRNDIGQLGTADFVNRSTPVQITGYSSTIISTLFKEVATDGYTQQQTFAIRNSDSALFAWGQDLASGLGDGSTDNKSSPVQIGSFSWNKVATAGRQTAAITTDGALYTWGNNTYGNLGDGTVTIRSTPVKIGSSSWIFVDVSGTYHMVGLTTDGNLFAWGNNADGQVGYVTNLTAYSSPIKIPTSYVMVSSSTSWLNQTDWTGPSLGSFYWAYQGRIAAGGNVATSFAIRSDWSLWTWGLGNPNFNLGDGTSVIKSSPVNIGGAAAGAGSGTTPGYSYTMVAGSALMTFAISTSGLMYAWGNQSIYGFGGYGVVGTAIRSWPTMTGNSQSLGWSYQIVATSLGGAHTAAIKDTGDLIMWGSNTNGQIGAGTTGGANRSYPVYIYNGGLYSPLAVACGNSHTMAINAVDGKLFTWGAGANGQLGHGLTTTINLPAQRGTSNWVRIAAGTAHSMGIDSAGRLFTWGSSATGQGGRGDTTQRSSPMQVGSSTWARIASGTSHCAAITTDGALWTWGGNSGGQLGDGTTINKSSPVKIKNGTSFVAVSCSTSGTTAITTTGEIYSWSTNTGVMGDSTFNAQTSPITPVPSAAGSSVLDEAQNVYSSWTVVNAGLVHTTAITVDGALWVWGKNTFGTLGDNSSVTSRSLPVKIGSSSWTAVNAGYYNTMAIDATGKLFTWGYGTNGQIGDGQTIDRSSPVQIGTKSWTLISAGQAMLAVDRTGTLYSWGNNFAGQVGDGSTDNKSSPVQIGTFSWSKISAGGSNAAAINTNGTLYVWGGNAKGQIGDGTTINKSSPVAIGFETSYSASETSFNLLSSGSGNFFYSRSITGKLYSWGNNFAGQLGTGAYSSLQYPLNLLTGDSNNINKIVTTSSGTASILNNLGVISTFGNGSNGELGDGTTTARSSPVAISIGTGSSAAVLKAGYAHLAALTTTGILNIWGDNSAGQLGDSTTVSRSSASLNPYQMKKVEDYPFKSIAINGSPVMSAAAIRVTDGSLWTWGGNNFGQLGNGTTIDQTSPTRLDNKSWSMVTSGLSYMHAIDSTGALYAWGEGANGQLGDNTTSAKSSPVKIGNSSWSFISNGNSHSVAIDVTGALYTWGNNSAGQIGDNTTISKSSPVKIGSSSWITVSAAGLTSGGITTSNTLYTWGDNSAGQLGDSTTVNKSSPTQIYYNVSRSYSIESYYFDGTGSWLRTPNAVANQPGSGNFTIEAWIQTNYTSSQTVPLICQSQSFTGSGEWFFGIRGSILHVRIGANIYEVSVPAWNGQTWRHIAWVRNGSSTNNNTLYLDGAVAVQFTNTTTLDGIDSGSVAKNLSIGNSDLNPTNKFYGYISNLRMVKGTAVYTSDFVPVPPLTAIANTALLTVKSATLVDESTNAFTLQNIGGVSRQPFSSMIYTSRDLNNSSWKLISIGQSHSVGANTNDFIYTWGNNTNGQLGNYSVVSKSTPTLVDPAYFSNSSSTIKVIAKDSATAVIKSNGSAYTFGADGLGGYINQSKSQPSILANSKKITKWRYIASGFNPALAISDYDGSVWGWGTNGNGQLGSGYISPDFSLGFPNFSEPASRISWTQLDISGNFTAGIDNMGSLYTWGSGSNGVLGQNNNVANASSPGKVGTSSWSAVTTGILHMLALDKDGYLFTWGYNLYGQLGDGQTIDRSSPVQIGARQYRKIAAGNHLSLAIDTTGALWTWGLNNNGQLGTFNYSATVGRSSPVQIGLSSWTFVAASRITYNAAAIDINGRLFTWGDGAGGALGTNAVASRSSPVQVGALTWASVQCGESWMAGITTTGALYTWGYNAASVSWPASGGVLGDGTRVSKSAPVKIGNSSWSMIAASDISAKAIDINGRLFAWGWNEVNALGTGDTISRSSPVQIGTSLTNIRYSKVPVVTGWKDINFSFGTFYAIDSADSLFAWGNSANNAFGAFDSLGNRSAIDILPISLSSLSAVDLALGNNTTILLSNDNLNNTYLHAWGNNSVGQFGDGTVNSTSSPVLVTQLAKGYTANLFSGGSGSNFRR